MKNLEEENKKFKNELINEINTQKEIHYMKEINPIINTESKIIKKNLFKQLNYWINPTISLEFKLIYVASTNGDSSINFHKFCGGEGPTVTIIKAKNGYIFGGYVIYPFGCDGKHHYDEKAFLFSLTNLKKFPIKIKEKAVYHGPFYSLFFGDSDLVIGSLRTKDSYCEPKSYEFNRVELIGSPERDFVVEDYEVYLVI